MLGFGDALDRGIKEGVKGEISEFTPKYCDAGKRGKLFGSDWGKEAR